jgi:hypothetical protein
VRVAAEVLGDYPNESAALRAVAEKPGVGSVETLRRRSGWYGLSVPGASWRR